MSKITPRMLSAHSADRLWRMLEIAIHNKDIDRFDAVLGALHFKTPYPRFLIGSNSRFKDAVHRHSWPRRRFDDEG